MWVLRIVLVFFRLMGEAVARSTEAIFHHDMSPRYFTVGQAMMLGLWTLFFGAFLQMPGIFLNFLDDLFSKQTKARVGQVILAEKERWANPNEETHAKKALERGWDTVLDATDRWTERAKEFARRQIEDIHADPMTLTEEEDRPVYWLDFLGRNASRAFRRLIDTAMKAVSPPLAFYAALVACMASWHALTISSYAPRLITHEGKSFLSPLLSGVPDAAIKCWIEPLVVLLLGFVVWPSPPGSRFEMPLSLGIDPALGHYLMLSGIVLGVMAHLREGDRITGGPWELGSESSPTSPLDADNRPVASIVTARQTKPGPPLARAILALDPIHQQLLHHFLVEKAQAAVRAKRTKRKKSRRSQ